MKTIKEMKQKIEDKYDGIPEGQISAGNYLQSVGRKYVHVLNTWETTSIDKIEISEFYDRYMR